MKTIYVTEVMIFYEINLHQMHLPVIDVLLMSFDVVEKSVPWSCMDNKILQIVITSEMVYITF